MASPTLLTPTSKHIPLFLKPNLIDTPTVAKYRREKALLGKASFWDMYSALNAILGHCISFGPIALLSANRKARILEEMDTIEKALLRER
ncbi:hypothetical protein SLA2020_215780 [Shorea laevis]